MGISYWEHFFRQQTQRILKWNIKIVINYKTCFLNDWRKKWRMVWQCCTCVLHECGSAPRISEKRHFPCLVLSACCSCPPRGTRPQPVAHREQLPRHTARGTQRTAAATHGPRHTENSCCDTQPVAHREYLLRHTARSTAREQLPPHTDRGTPRTAASAHSKWHTENSCSTQHVAHGEQLQHSAFHAENSSLGTQQVRHGEQLPEHMARLH